MVVVADPASLPASAGRPPPPRLTLAAVVAGVAVTIVGLRLPGEAVAYRSPTFHVAVETTAGLIVLLVCYLAWGRFRHSRRLRDLGLVYAAGLLAAVNLLYSALPVVLGHTDSGWLTWKPLTGSLLAGVVFAGAAFSADRRIESTRRARLLLWSGWVVAMAAISLLASIAPPDQPTSLRGARALLEAPVLELLGHGVATLLYAAAAGGHWRQLRRTGDDMLVWLSAGLTLAAFARLNHLLLPGLYPTWLYTGDLLRLGFYLLLLAGAAREIHAYWQDRAEIAVLEERRRMARDLHDGLSQELAYVVAHARRLHDGDSSAGRALQAAAERALDEARRAITALTRPVGEPLEVALAREAEQVAIHGDTKVHLNLDSGLVPDPEVYEAALRITREGIINAVRHGGAEQVTVEVHNGQKLTLRITDDGRGFDPQVLPGQGFGLISMRERAEAMGGSFTIDSAPGRGTTVEVVWPTT